MEVSLTWRTASGFISSSFSRFTKFHWHLPIGCSTTKSSLLFTFDKRKENIISRRTTGSNNRHTNQSPNSATSWFSFNCYSHSVFVTDIGPSWIRILDKRQGLFLATATFVLTHWQNGRSNFGKMLRMVWMILKGITGREEGISIESEGLGWGELPWNTAPYGLMAAVDNDKTDTTYANEIIVVSRIFVSIRIKTKGLEEKSP